MHVLDLIQLTVFMIQHSVDFVGGCGVEKDERPQRSNCASLIAWATAAVTAPI